MYLYIFEDGEVKTASSFCDTDKESVDAGAIVVIDIESKPPMNYYDGEWHILESADA